MQRISKQSINGNVKVELSQTAPDSTKRLYKTLPSKQEFEKISFILDALGNHYLVTLLANKEKIQEAGRQLPSIHVLRFLTTAITNPELSKNLNKVRKRTGSVRNSMRSDYSIKLEKEDNQNNLKCYIDQFATDAKLDATKLHKLADEKRWNDFFDTVLDSVRN